MLTGGGWARWKTVLGTFLMLDALVLFALDSVVTDVARVSLGAPSPSDNSSGVDSSRIDDWVLGKETIDLADAERGERALAM